MPTTVPARARGTDTDEALALTVDPDLRKVCRSVPKAFSTWAVVPLKLMVRWLAGMAPTVKPAARNHAVTAATSEARGANRARHCAGVTKAPYCALAGSETAAARDSAPAGSRRARTAVRCCCCPAGVWPTRTAWVVQAGASSSVVRGEGAAAWARAGLRPATASVTAAVALTTAPLRSVGAMSGSSVARVLSAGTRCADHPRGPTRWDMSNVTHPAGGRQPLGPVGAPAGRRARLAMCA